MIRGLELQAAISNLQEQVARAGNEFADKVEYGSEWANPSWQIEACYIQLLAVLEAFGMPELRSTAHAEYQAAKTSESGFLAAESDHIGIHPVALNAIRRYLLALGSLLPKEEHAVASRALLDIIKSAQYAIADETVFPAVPRNEREVHDRVEAILKCMFPELKREPVITKQIKNFKPDTGIPSLRTLIEYKYLSRKDDIGRLADQLLADTRGYASQAWKRFIYVIYETRRFRREDDWNQLMRESGVPGSTTVVVLTGEPRRTPDTGKRHAERTLVPAAGQEDE